ncbi:MAG: peptidyl-alpha-hydroxyglycine alpha-amidating lyase family protein [Planctomycetota bacterium]|nr:peptidyl-alpha-hydroxyglycine alpha-amidating lyase family protein [Planctomycetota bacterium]
MSLHASQILFGLIGLLFTLPHSGSASDRRPAARTVQPAGYVQVENWPKLPANRKLGQVTGVAVDAQQRIYIFHRANRKWTTPFPAETISGQTIAVFHRQTGELISTLGDQKFIMPHGLSSDADGNLWTTDVGSHQVHKISPRTGQILLTLGTAGTPGNDQQHFARPTDVGFSKNGTVFVTDGYINTRVVKFSSSGKYLGEWGNAGSHNGEFDLPHGIAVFQERVYVCDRSNLRVQVFDLRGKYLDQWKGTRIGRPFGIATDHQGWVYLIDGGDQPDHTRSRVVVLDQRGRFKSTFDAARSEDQKNLGHDIAVDQEGAIYVADAWANCVRKFIRKH